MPIGPNVFDELMSQDSPRSLNQFISQLNHELQSSQQMFIRTPPGRDREFLREEINESRLQMNQMQQRLVALQGRGAFNDITQQTNASARNCQNQGRHF